MSGHEQYASVAGSECRIPSGASRVGDLDPNEPIEVSVYVRPRAGGQPTPTPHETRTGRRKPLSREDYAASHGADQADLAQVEAFARGHHLDVVQTDPARRLVVLRGPASAMSDAFGVELHQYEESGNTYRAYSGSVRVPADLGPIVEGVFGLHQRPQARPLVRMSGAASASTVVNPRQAPVVSYTPAQVASLYDFPTASDGSGQSVAIIELGGGYQESDLRSYFEQLGIPLPTVVSVPVDGASNNPGVDSGADTEVALDIDIVGAVAPGATVVVYFAPNTDRGFLDAVTTAVHDTTYRPSVISISWGSAEPDWSSMAMRNLDQAFQAAAAVGVTVCCASGDSGSSDRVDDGLAHVDFPASSPSALGCGGTRLLASNGQIASEVVWNHDSGATGGGVSDVFDLPDWQADAGVPPSANPNARVGRGVPDVAADADPATGYDVQVGGQLLHGIGGTSAAAPLWAGLIALINSSLDEPAGFINPIIYDQSGPAAEAVRDITEGNNGAYEAGPGWDACTGLGTPNGTKLLTALQSISE